MRLRLAENLLPLCGIKTVLPRISRCSVEGRAAVPFGPWVRRGVIVTFWVQLGFGADVAIVGVSLARCLDVEELFRIGRPRGTVSPAMVLENIIRVIFSVHLKETLASVDRIKKDLHCSGPLSSAPLLEQRDSVR